MFHLTIVQPLPTLSFNPYPLPYPTPTPTTPIFNILPICPTPTCNIPNLPIPLYSLLTTLFFLSYPKTSQPWPLKHTHSNMYNCVCIHYHAPTPTHSFTHSQPSSSYFLHNYSITCTPYSTSPTLHIPVPIPYHIHPLLTPTLSHSPPYSQSYFHPLTPPPLHSYTLPHHPNPHPKIPILPLPAPFLPQNNPLPPSTSNPPHTPNHILTTYTPILFKSTSQYPTSISIATPANLCREGSTLCKCLWKVSLLQEGLEKSRTFTESL